MTLANAIGQSGIKALGPLHIEVFPEASSQSFTGAHFLNLSSGLLQMGATAHATNNLGADGATTTLILGKANKSAVGTARTAIPVTCANDSTMFSIPVWHTSDSGTNVRLREALSGDKFEVGNRTANQPDSTAGNVTNTWVLDTASTTNVKMRVCSFVARDNAVVPGKQGVAWSSTSGEKYGHVWAKVIATSRGLG